MNQDDDVERLFSWLQTPDLRYREFAGAREVTDAAATWQGRPNTPVVEVAPTLTPSPSLPAVSEFSDFRTAEPSPSVTTAPVRETVMRETVTRETVMREAAIREPAIIAPIPTAPFAEPRPFDLGAGGREAPRAPEVVATSALPPSEPEPPQLSPPAPAEHIAASDVPGVTHRESEGAAEDTAKSTDSQSQQSRPLDAVFGRLAGGNTRPPDPRERLRHIPGLGPPAGRPR